MPTPCSLGVTHMTTPPSRNFKVKLKWTDLFWNVLLMFLGDVSDRYSQLESMIAERSNLLQTALTESHSVQEGLESLLAWLDTTETTLDRLQNRTSITLRKEPLNDQMQQYKVRRGSSVSLPWAAWCRAFFFNPWEGNTKNQSWLANRKWMLCVHAC